MNWYVTLPLQSPPEDLLTLSASTVRFLGMTKFLFHQLKSEDDKYNFVLVEVFLQSAWASQSNSVGDCLPFMC